MKICRPTQIKCSGRPLVPPARPDSQRRHSASLQRPVRDFPTGYKSKSAGYKRERCTRVRRTRRRHDWVQLLSGEPALHRADYRPGIVDALPARICTVGVFVDADPEKFASSPKQPAFDAFNCMDIQRLNRAANWLGNFA